jgi:hypothetical protein
MPESAPWTFEQAVKASEAASAAQTAVEESVLDAYKGYAHAEKLFRVALARKMLELKSAGMAVTACETVAKGDETIALLRYERDLAEGVREAARHAAWKASADRRDTEALLSWSMRRDLADWHGHADQAEPAGAPYVYGARRAA